jgi:hypothetical protein
MAKKTYVDEAIADAVHMMEQQTQEVDFEHNETRRKLSATDDAVKDLTRRFKGLESKIDGVDRLPAELKRRITQLLTLPGKLESVESQVVGMAEALDLEDRRREEDNQRTERRWADELARLETRVEEKMDERFEEQDRKLADKQTANVVDFHSYVDESLKRLHTEIQKDWWIAELERREKVRSEEMKTLLNQRPTHDEIAESYTTLATTSQVINQVAELHTKTGREHHLLQSGLNTLERLYLRQLDSSADVVSAIDVFFHILLTLS